MRHDGRPANPRPAGAAPSETCHRANTGLFLLSPPDCGGLPGDLRPALGTQLLGTALSPRLAPEAREFLSFLRAPILHRSLARLSGNLPALLFRQDFGPALTASLPESYSVGILGHPLSVPPLRKQFQATYFMLDTHSAKSDNNSDE